MKFDYRVSGLVLATVAALATGQRNPLAAAETSLGLAVRLPTMDSRGTQEAVQVQRIRGNLRRMEAARVWSMNLGGKGPSPLANPYRLRTMVLEHQRLMTGMLGTLSVELTDPAAQELIGDIRRDLERLAEMRTGQIEAFLPRHAARVSRLLRMHESVAGNG